MYNTVNDNYNIYDIENIILTLNDLSLYMLIITIVLVIIFIHFEYQFYKLKNDNIF